MRVLMYIFLLLLMLTSCSEDYSRPSQEFITIPDGIFSFGAGNEGTIVPCRVNTFQLATTEVSNEQFEAFVNATSYVTSAEKQGGFIFDEGWKLVKEANWRKPEGQAISYEAWKNLPVVQVSYADAMAYCDWANCRLPSEIEWEYAAKMGMLDASDINITRPEQTHPRAEKVQSFKKNEQGIYHQLGNVWEWCADVYHSEIHDKLALHSTTEPFDAFQGRSYDPEKMDASDTLRVIKGGSFLCQKGHCEGYRPEARQSSEQSEAYFHIGFRVVRD